VSTFNFVPSLKVKVKVKVTQYHAIGGTWGGGVDL
jgi:hypothetical protein